MLLGVLRILSHLDRLGVNHDPCENGVSAPKTHLKNAACVLNLELRQMYLPA